VKRNTGFELLIPETTVPQTRVPTREEVELIRNRIDPDGLLLEAKIQ
jgi:hypothetical protein